MVSLKAKALDGGDVTLKQSAIDSLKTAVHGTVLTEGDSAYDKFRAVWNAMIDRRPALIVRCIGTTDVIAALKFARDTGVAVSIRGGGHNVAGLAVADGALMVDLSLMRGVLVDPEKRIAHAQAGCTLGDVDCETQLYGLAAVLGFVSNTGIAGLTLGGGFGYLTKRYGWACDNLRSIQVVTAEGKLVRASAREEPELFWAMRGGGGNFGVATSFEYELHPVGPEIFGGAIAWRGEDAEEVMAMYERIVESSPPEMVCSLGFRVGTTPWLAKEVQGKPIVVMTVCDHGEASAAEKRVNQIKSVGKPVEDLLGRRSYVGMQSFFDAAQPNGRRHYWKAEYTARITQNMLKIALAHSTKIDPSSYSRITFFPVRGKLNELPDDHSAVGNRKAEILANVWGSWSDERDDARNMTWTREAWADLRKFSVGTYVNMLSDDEAGRRIEEAYGRNLKRLTDVKSKYDPGNFFRANKNIAPAQAVESRVA
jgi:FAD/FMN-containing dehydrogenase